MYSGVLTNVPAFEQPATMSWLRYLLVVKGGGAGAPRAGCCAAIPTAATTKSAADARTRFNSFTNLLLHVVTICGINVPLTSVSRIARPLYRYVSFVWVHAEQVQDRRMQVVMGRASASLLDRHDY